MTTRFPMISPKITKQLAPRFLQLGMVVWEDTCFLMIKWCWMSFTECFDLSSWLPKVVPHLDGHYSAKLFLGRHKNATMVWGAVNDLAVEHWLNIGLLLCRSSLFLLFFLQCDICKFIFVWGSLRRLPSLSLIIIEFRLRYMFSLACCWYVFSILPWHENKVCSSTQSLRGRW